MLETSVIDLTIKFLPYFYNFITNKESTSVIQNTIIFYR